MAKRTSLKYELVITQELWGKLYNHLFPGDGDEHGAVIAASISRTETTVKLLVRNLFLAKDGVDYLPSPRGYRMLTADFVRDHALFCRDEKLAYLAIHNHGGFDSVDFSSDDIRSHERGYPALKDITRGQIVGGLVFAQNAVAGDLWLADERVQLSKMRIVGHKIKDLYPTPPKPIGIDMSLYDRQARLFGERGQEILKNQKVAIIGLGGIGSLVSEYLARLGVGTLLLVDPDTLDKTNIPRVVESIYPQKLGWIEKIIKRLLKQPLHDEGSLKVDIAERGALKANPSIKIIKYAKNVVYNDVALELANSDYIFLAADSMQARLVFNSIVHQYLVPGCQLGSKVPVDKKSGKVGKVFSVTRPVLPGEGCLWCNGLISSDGLQKEALSEEERRAQQYVQEEDIIAPSVITLNAVSAANAVNDYLFRVTSMREITSNDYTYYEPRTNNVRTEEPRKDLNCLECSAAPNGRFAMGDAKELPTRSN